MNRNDNSIMKIATLLFTYNRPNHTLLVLEGLKRNTILPEKLYIFHDGFKQGTDINKWLDVRTEIHQVDFCEKEVIESPNNKGLSNSIIDGINYVFKENYDAVIVLEDDCVPAKEFIRYMNQALEFYVNYCAVWNISGYKYPNFEPPFEYDAFSNGRISSWGWGTWKNRWSKYVIDYDILNRVMNDKSLSIRISRWGKDLPQMLVNRMYGKNDSWAVFWALIVIENRGVNISPSISLIENVGMDGSGVHCDYTDIYHTDVDDRKIEQFKFPIDINPKESVIRQWRNIYGLSINTYDASNKQDIIVYGTGNCFLDNEKIIAERFNVVAFIDRQYSGYFAGVPYIQTEEIVKYVNVPVIICIYDSNTVKRVKEMLLSYDENIKFISLE